jgi:hypothetical protein
LYRLLAGQRHAPVVYFARMGDNVKIGTSMNLKGRMRGFYLTLDDVLAIVPGGEDVEDAYHERFAASRIQDDDRRELFRLDERLSYFLGLSPRHPESGQRSGLPFHLMSKSEVGNVPDLDNELRTLVDSRGPLDMEKAEDLVARLTYLGEDREHRDDALIAELVRAETVVLYPYHPRWWFLTATGRRERRNERADRAWRERLAVRFDRAVIISDLFEAAQAEQERRAS